MISHFEAYHKFEDANSELTQLPLPEYIQSLDANDIYSETVALSSAFASGILADFLDDDALLATVSGRMGSGNFDFVINDLKSKRPCEVRVRNSQIEIDAAYEGVRGLTLFEAKRNLADDFLIRQLYYPFRTWRHQITKPVRPVYLTFSNGIYRLYEYAFQEPGNYNSLVLVKQKNYSIEDTSISIADVQALLARIKFVTEPKIPFPQADRFERIINLCELLSEQPLDRNEITERYAFDVRQTDYYVAAARYLGLVIKKEGKEASFYSLSKEGKRILKLNYKQRQLAYCNLILSHEVFAVTLQDCLSNGCIPSRERVVQFMRESRIYKVESETTFCRRASTIIGWVNWIVKLLDS